MIGPCGPIIEKKPGQWILAEMIKKYSENLFAVRMIGDPKLILKWKNWTASKRIDPNKRGVPDSTMLIGISTIEKKPQEALTKLQISLGQ